MIGRLLIALMTMWKSIPNPVKTSLFTNLASFIADKLKKSSSKKHVTYQAPIAPIDRPTKPSIVDFIMSYEGCKLKAYKDSAGVWTIGYGNTKYLDGSPVKRGDVITKDQAIELLYSTVESTRQQVKKKIKSSIRPQQLDALVSLTYNIGIGNFSSSTILKLVNKDPNDPAIADYFIKYRHAGGKYYLGLLRRRLAEATLYFS